MLRNRIIAFLAFLILGSSTFGATAVYAQGANSSHPNFFQGLIDFISQKFGLDKTQVQSVVNDYQNQQKQTNQANMQQKQKTRLDQLVTQGKITQDQENLIVAKLQELQTNRQNWKNLTVDQRKTAMTAEKTDLQNWAKINNIDIKYLLGFGRGRKMGWTK